MKYSYIKPRKKTILFAEFQLLLIFFSITISMLFLTYTFLLFKDYKFEQDRVNISEQRADINISISKMTQQISFIEKENFFAERIYTKNTVLKESIANLFDLVPQRIILSEAKLLESGLILYGITPSKDIYNFMLQAPLRSIFHTTYNSFYPLQNGWFRFVSTNYINEDNKELYRED